MIIKCKACGANLEYRKNQETAVCKYCGSTNVLPQAEDRKSAISGAKPAKTKTLLWIFGTVLLFSLIPLLLIRNGPARAFREWYSPGFPVDANGDEYLDIVGFSGSPTDQYHLTTVDGATGEIIRTTEGYDEALKPEIFCPSTNYICVFKSDLTVDVVDPVSLKTTSAFTVTDRIGSYWFAGSVLCVNTLDRDSLAVDLSTGKQADFITAPKVNYYSYVQLSSQHTDTATGIRYVAENKPGSLSLLLVSALKDTTVLWKTPLRYKNTASAPPLAVTDHMVITYGQGVGSDKGTLIGIDRKDGMVRYEAEQGSTWSAWINSLCYNSKVVVIWYGFGLHGFDPDTGERLWHIGGR